jgi:predicted phosphodiesterase
MPLERIFRVEHYPNIPDKRRLQVFQMTDVHLGAKTYIKEAFKQQIKKIKKTRFTKVILTGDILENNTKTSVGEGVYEETMTPNDQLLEIIDILRPIKNKIIGISRGNHEKRTSKSEGIDLCDVIARNLDVPRLMDHSLHRFHFGDESYTLLTTHGKSGASTIGGKINAVEKLVHIYGADAYLYGHVHHLLTWNAIVYGVDGIKLRHFGINGSFMDYLDSYAQEAEYRPGMPGYITAMVGNNGIELKEHWLLEYMNPGLLKTFDERSKGKVI